MSEVKAILAVNPINKNLKYEKIVSNHVGENEPVFYIDEGISFMHPFNDEERLKIQVNTVNWLKRENAYLEQQLKTKDEKIEKLIECLKYYRDETTDIIAVRAKRALEEIKEQGE